MEAEAEKLKILQCEVEQQMNMGDSGRPSPLMRSIAHYCYLRGGWIGAVPDA